MSLKLLKLVEGPIQFINLAVLLHKGIFIVLLPVTA